ncbi:MAG: NADH-dependent flavin oxidoreductase [Tenericutes bacterium]|nr:NADH-dependent flavin oxidoreductase [Mycoplasmatota bacterium]
MNKAFTEYTFANGKKLRNRLVLAPMTTYSSNNDLTLSKEEEIHYNARAKNFGMVIAAATAISRNAQGFQNQISIMDESYLPSMSRLATAIKKEGSVAILQLYHGGRMNMPNLYENQDIVSASAVKANRDYCVIPRALETKEVYEIINDFLNAMKLAMIAGFDGVEMHGANTYLLQQFFSPHSNQREDEFGGTVKKRLRFPLELVKRAQKLREELKRSDFIIGYRLSPEELEEPGISLDDTMVLVEELTKQKIDYIHLSLGRYNQSSLKDAENKKTVISYINDVVQNRVPIIGVGQIEDMDSINDAFESGFSLLSMGMIALSDPFVVIHLKDGLKPIKHFSEKSLIPTNIYQRMLKGVPGNKRGFTISEK